ncbi:hypothetical protein Tco_0183736 [Tanacetum coccineum]
MEDDYKPTVQSQRRVNPKIHEVIKKEVLKLLDAGMIHPISDSPWVSLVHCVPERPGNNTFVANEENELIPTRLVTGWRVCIDYRKLNEATRKDHFPLPFMDQMIERLAGNEFYCFLDGFSGYFQIPIASQDQEKTPFTMPLELSRPGMPFWLVEGIVLGHKISKSRIEADRAKVDVITKLPHPTTVKGVRSFLGLLKDADEAPIVVVRIGTYRSRTMCDARISRLNLISPSVIKKGSENLAADHLSRLENPHKDVLENKDINEHFPLETLGVISSESTPIAFTDYANYHAGILSSKECQLNKRRSFSRTLNIISGTILIFFVLVRIKSFEGMCTGKKLLKSSKLVMKDPPGAITVPISPLKKYLMLVSFGLPYIEMHIQ